MLDNLIGLISSLKIPTTCFLVWLNKIILVFKCFLRVYNMDEVIDIVENMRLIDKFNELESKSKKYSGFNSVVET